MTDVEDRIGELEARVEALEAALTDSPPSIDGPADRYDSAVLDRLRDAGEPVVIRQLYAWYRRAGVKSEQKIKQRLRDLDSAGLIEGDGRRWRYDGPRQAALEELA